MHFIIIPDLSLFDFSASELLNPALFPRSLPVFFGQPDQLRIEFHAVRTYVKPKIANGKSGMLNQLGHGRPANLCDIFMELEITITFVICYVTLICFHVTKERTHIRPGRGIVRMGSVRRHIFSLPTN